MKSLMREWVAKAEQDFLAALGTMANGKEANLEHPRAGCRARTSAEAEGTGDALIILEVVGRVPLPGAITFDALFSRCPRPG
jgi:hypothetical protein